MNIKVSLLQNAAIIAYCAVMLCTTGLNTTMAFAQSSAVTQATLLESKWSIGGFYRAKATYPLSVQNALCGECDYLLSMMPTGEIGVNTRYQVNPTMAVLFDASWNTHGYSFGDAAPRNLPAPDVISTRYMVAARYLSFSPAIVLHEAIMHNDTKNDAKTEIETEQIVWQWFAGIGIGVPLSCTITRSDVGANGAVSAERYLYPSTRALEPLVEIRTGTLIPLPWKGLHLSFLLNYNVSNVFKTSDGYSSSTERANALGISFGVQYLLALAAKR